MKLVSFPPAQMKVAFTSLILSGLSSLTAASAFSDFLDAGHVIRSTTCEEIATKVSSESVVYYNDSSQYQKDNYHWASSSSQASECSFEPATTEDVGIALQILGKTRTPFAVKSGGHTTNPGFSSTSGVQIAMYSFSEVVYDADAKTATVGTGLAWDDVYTALEEYGVTVVGAKATGLGVGGVTLGGGYSFLANQYGLALDNVVAYELVLPNGTVANITSSTNSDLFFGLRGGTNNFGIVTRVTLKTHPQSQIWGGTLLYSQDQSEAVNSAIANFCSNVSDPKASLYHTYNYMAGVAAMFIILFYDAPTYPDGIFDDFLAISHTDQGVSTRSYSSIVKSVPLNSPTGYRSVFYTMAVEEFTVPVLDMMANETLFWGAELANSSALVISYDVEPFQSGLYDHTDTPSAYPPSRSQSYSFITVYYGWTNSSYDDTMVDAVYKSAKYMTQVLTDANQDIANVAVYPNGAPPGMPLKNMFGENLPRLRAIKNDVDPDTVMGLTGGWKF